MSRHLQILRLRSLLGKSFKILYFFLISILLLSPFYTDAYLDLPRLDGDIMAKYVEPGSFEQTLKDPGDPALPSEKMNGEDKVGKVVSKTLTDPGVTNQGEAEQRCTRITEQKSDIAKMRDEDSVGKQLPKNDPDVDVEQLLSRIAKQDLVIAQQKSEIDGLKMKVAEKQLEDKPPSDQINHLKKALEAKENDIFHLEAAITRNEEKIASITRELQKWVNKSKTSVEELENVKEERKLDKRRLEEYYKLTNDLNSQVKDLKLEKDFLDGHTDSMCVQLEDRDELVKLLAADKSLEGMTEMIETLQRERATLKEINRALKRQVSALEEQVQTLRERERGMNGEL